jgi:hypothetical protein
MNMKAHARTTRIAAILLGLAAAVVFAGIGPAPQATSAENEQAVKASALRTEAGEIKLSGPYTHKNLTVYLIHGEDRIKDKEFVTLQEALELKKITIYETGNVNSLIVENNSDLVIYIHSGDIIKGGKQDRMVPHDIILPPRCGKITISVFCVEQGRWRQRGKENVAAFAESGNAVAGRELKLAARLTGEQREVWDKVSKEQAKLTANAGLRVETLESSSSMELTLSDKKVQDAAEEYVKALSGIIEGKKDAIGFVFAINGKPNSADVYACNSLFRKLWPKLIKAASIEAVAEYRKDQTFKEVAADAIKEFMADAEKGKKTSKEVAKDVTMEVRETKENVLFRTRAAGAAKEYDDVHTNYVRK